MLLYRKQAVRVTCVRFGSDLTRFYWFAGSDRGSFAGETQTLKKGYKKSGEALKMRETIFWSPPKNSRGSLFFKPIITF
jgi:hypothetical protein